MERPLTPGLPVKKGQLVLKTGCSICHRTQRNPTAAAKHVTRHRKQRPAVENNPPQLQEQGVNGPTFGGTWPIPDTVVCEATCLDRGDSRASTPCLCKCHYQGPTARQMIKEAHRDDESD